MIFALVTAYKDEWGWNEVDVARVMAKVLPGSASTGRKIRLPQAADGNEPEFARTHALAQALRQQDEMDRDGINASSHEDRLVPAIVALRERKQKRRHKGPQHLS